LAHPIVPVIKITANPKTAAAMSEHIDVDVSDLLSLKIGVAEAGERILDYAFKVMNGRLTAAEVLQHDEFSPIRLHISA
jgi:Altronate dehydratase